MTGEKLTLLISERTRKRILSYVMNQIHSCNLKWNDDFPLQIVDVYISFIESAGELPTTKSFVKRASRIKTTFFKLNHIKKVSFLEEILQALNRKFSGVLKEIEKQRNTSTYKQRYARGDS